MSLKPSEILTLLASKRDDFTRFNKSTSRSLQAYRTAWQRLPQAETDAQLDLMPPEGGAQLLESMADLPQGIVRFPEGTPGPIPFPWDSREASLAWVREQIAGVTTFAVDGSQIFPSKDFSIPIALVQIGWFENPHLPDGSYRKDIQVDVMTPADLQVKDSAEPVDRRVNVRRFELETHRLVTYMQEVKDPSRCLVFFDGSLVATFAEAFDEETRSAYVKALLSLLRTSQQTRVPLVGYVDTSYARDVTTWLQQSAHLPEAEAIHDAQIVNPMMAWGDRTPVFRCDRTGILQRYGDQRDQIVFTYLKTNRDSYPARLEMPYWLWESGRVPQILDWVRSEVIVGGGYPYAIETADQTAVLQANDRQIFYRLLQDWAEKENLHLRMSRKLISKVRRR